MKKILLLSLLLMVGGKSFALVSGSESRAEMQVVVKGNVVDKTGDNLIIEPIKNGNSGGTQMEFEIGGIFPSNEYKNFQGTFAIYRAGDSVIGGNDIKIGIISNTGGTPISEDTTFLGEEGKRVEIKYTVDYGKSSDDKKINGTLNIGVKAEEGAVGEFIDTSKKIAISVGAV